MCEATVRVPAGSATDEEDENFGCIGFQIVGEAGWATVCADVAVHVLPDPFFVRRWHELMLIPVGPGGLLRQVLRMLPKER